jgi:hypothetical protein
MAWTKEQQLEALLRLPWSIDRETTMEGDVVLRVREVPSAIGTGESDPAREEDLWESLRESLRAYLHFGDTPPLPPKARLPWRAVQGGASVRRAAVRAVPAGPDVENTSSGLEAVPM